MQKEYEKTNEPMIDRLERAEKSYAAGRITCPNPAYVVAQLREITDRIRRMHTEETRRAA